LTSTKPRTAESAGQNTSKILLSSGASPLDCRTGCAAPIYSRTNVHTLEKWWPLVLLAATGEALAQASDTNVVTASTDAFGVAIGVESLGLYGPSQVRGFDPLAAGNARIEGMYVDLHGSTIPYGPLPARLVQDTRIRVGPAAAGFPFPSPTGIVDFSLRSPLGAAGISPTLYIGPYGTSGFDLDVHAPVAGNHCGTGGGITRRWDEFVPGLTQFTTDVGLIAACRTSGDSGFSVFYGRTTETQQDVYPTVYLTTAPLPTPVEARNTAPTWARGTAVLTDYGGLFRLEAPGHWTLRAGLFRSSYDQPLAGSDLLYDPNSAGIAQHQYVSYADQSTGSTSGELRATHLTTSGPRQYELLLTLRARDVTERYGGDDQVDLGTVLLGTRPAVAEPVFTYGPLTHDHILEWMGGAAYAVHWRDTVEFAAGLEQVRYERTVTQPGGAPVSSRETPLLYYTSIGLTVSSRASVYATLSRGLEDSGLAPASAANRGELLPASRTAQEEIGVRYTAGATTLVAGLFEVRKPYYNVDTAGTYTWLGTESHRGGELSVHAQPLTGLTVLAGAVLMSPQVAVRNGPGTVGSAPVGQPRRLLELAADYQLPFCPRCSLDIAGTQQGPVPVRLDDGAYNPTQTLVNVGARYRFSVMGRPAAVRIQIQNVTNRKVWAVGDPSGGLVAYPPRHMAIAYLAAEF
jgi:iron complex outermembrane recepter protein